MASSKTALSPTAVKDINADIGRTGAPSNTVAAATDLEHRENISSPHELTDWVDSLIDSLQNKFDGMGRGMDQRISEMSRRIDLLESSIEELIQGHALGSGHTAPSSTSAHATERPTKVIKGKGDSVSEGDQQSLSAAERTSTGPTSEAD